METVHRIRPSRWLWISVIGAAIALYVLFVFESDGPDQIVVGTVTRVESHEICVAAHGEGPTCAHVDYPQEVSDFTVGDCVEMRRSAEGILEDVRPGVDCG